MERECLVSINNVCFSYGGGLVLSEVSLCVRRGEFVGIIGANGSGKSTLLKLILGQLSPVCGTVTVTPHARVGYVEQTTHASDTTFPATVREIVTLGLYRDIGRFRFPGEADRKKVDEALELVGLKGMEKRQILFLSGGEQQKVLIAKAIVSNPDLIILDEPMAGIDAAGEQSISSILVRLNKERGKTIIMVTHAFDKLKNVDRIYCLKDCAVEEETRVRI